MSNVRWVMQYAPYLLSITCIDIIGVRMCYRIIYTDGIVYIHPLM